MAIVTRGDRIAAVRSAKGFRKEEGQEVIDVRNKFIIPGLVNTHVHLATLADPPIAKAYLRRELYSGVTTVRDMAGDVRLLGELKREAEFDEIASPDIFFVAVTAGPEFFADARTHDAARGVSCAAFAGLRVHLHRLCLRAPQTLAQVRRKISPVPAGDSAVGPIIATRLGPGGSAISGGCFAQLWKPRSRRLQLPRPWRLAPSTDCPSPDSMARPIAL